MGNKCLAYKKKLLFWGCSLILGLTGAFVTAAPVWAVTIEVDGEPWEWENVTTYESGNENVAKWSVAKDKEKLYFYVQQKGGNDWSLPITNTCMDVSYGSGVKNETSQLRPVMDGNGTLIFKNAHYGDVAGTQSAYTRSQEANKYEIEFSVPLDYFAEKDFSLTYCDTTVSVNEIPDIAGIETPVTEEPVYNGITVDGNFKDWNAVAKTPVDKNGMVSTAMVFDGDWLYIYMKEESDGALSWSGEYSNGKFTIYTDTGRNTTFKLNTDSIEGIEGAKVAHSNLQYEIAIPASAVKQYKSTISYGYYNTEGMLIEDVANLQENDKTEKEFDGIIIDGSYADWDYYPHELVEYSTSGGTGGDAEAALYQDGEKLYGHVLSLLHRNEKEFQPFYIRVNEEENKTMQMQLVAADENGNIIPDAPLDNLDAGTYVFYLRDSNSGSTQNNVFADDAPIYGKLYLTVRKDGSGKSLSDEVEYEVDLEKLAALYDMDVSDMKLLQANYINIGGTWVSIGGTSSGAVVGITLCILVTTGVLVYRKRKCKVS